VLRDAEGLTHKYVKLRYTRIMWRHLNPAAAWWRRQRKTDLEVLWVALKAASPTIKEARAAFLNHCIQDPAWHDLSYAEIVSLIEHLE
jgi:hypothetical protein